MLQGRTVTSHNSRYGWPHRRERARWKRSVEAGGELCRRCYKPILPWQAWDRDHADSGGPRVYLGPSHARCNRGTPAASSPVFDPLVHKGWGPIPDDGNMANRWSRHWAGGFNTRCRKCWELGEACPDATVEEEAA
jgi:hypothetical protein